MLDCSSHISKLFSTYSGYFEGKTTEKLACESKRSSRFNPMFEVVENCITLEPILQLGLPLDVTLALSESDE